MIQNVSLDLEALHPEFVSSLRRSLNRLNEANLAIRKEAIKELYISITSQQLNARAFQEVAELLMKGVLKGFSDQSEVVRETAVKIVMELLNRCEEANPFLSYILAVLVDRTNATDLEGIANVPEVMRPPPGQKPKVLIKMEEKSEEVRMLYCKLIQKIVGLTDVDVMRRHLDDTVNVIRALVMDPCGDIQKESCYTLELLCKAYKNILLNYTQTMCKALLLPLVSKKSRIRIGALQALNEALQCGLWKFNAFVFEDLIGFRDPNSVPIRDFYNPSTNINYLATLIIDPNIRVREAFMKCLHEWICVLEDKYDHHGKLVPYVLSGLFDEDQGVQKIAFETIQEIGHQLEIEKQKQFRDNKQYAIDATWTWQGKMKDMPLMNPFVSRPRLGSRFFIRGHIRKMWFAIFREIQDLSVENRLRAAKLSLMGVIYTENYMTNHLDKFIPPFITALGSSNRQDIQVKQTTSKIFYYMGRYCEYSSYIHIMKAALKGECVQHPQFVRCSFKALARLTQGNLQCVPKDTGLCHKKKDVYDMMNMITELELDKEVTPENSEAVQDFVTTLLKGLKESASAADLEDILGSYFAQLTKLLLITNYEKNLAQHLPLSLKQSNLVLPLEQEWHSFFTSHLQQYRPSISEYFSELMRNPPTYGDANWKCLVGYWLLAIQINNAALANQAVQLMSESIRYNRLPEMVNSLVKICAAVLKQEKYDRSLVSATVFSVCVACEENMLKYRPQKKKPKYIEQQPKPSNPQEVILPDTTFYSVFEQLLEVLELLLEKKFEFPEELSAAIMFNFIMNTVKLRLNKPLTEQSVRVVWAFLQRIDAASWSAQKFSHEGKHTLPIIINYLVDKLETMESSTQHYTLVLAALTRCAELFPTCDSRLDRLPFHCPNYPELLEKLFKYTLDEKDVETRGRYHTLLLALCRKLRDWFEVELKMAGAHARHERQRLLESVLACCHK